MDYRQLHLRTVAELRAKAKQEGIKISAGANKARIVEILIAFENERAQTQAAPAPVEETTDHEPAAPVVEIKAVETAAPHEKPAPQVRYAAPQYQARYKQQDKLTGDYIKHNGTEAQSARTMHYPRRQDFVPQDPNTVNQAVSDILASGDCPRAEGILEPVQDGYGLLRVDGYLPSPHDIYVSAAQMRRFNLRTGDLVSGRTRPQREGDRYDALLYIDSINGEAPQKAMRRPHFEDLIPVYPEERIHLEMNGPKNDMALRAIDMLAPIGKGQRALIVSQPKAGKTVLLKKIAKAIAENHPEIYLIVLLIDERPEEVTDIQRSVTGDVVFSTFDEVPENHTHAAEMTLERAKRLVEQGKDVVILLDSLTRLARAYNLTVPPTGRTLSGGLDTGALHKPKSFFGAARNVEKGGSLTIIATALVETGSRMDDIIFEEFKGTGNSEIVLNRLLSERRIFPAIDMNRSGTRRDDLLLKPGEMDGALMVRRMLGNNPPQDTIEQLIGMLDKTKNNEEFFARMKGWMTAWEKEGFTRSK